MKLQHRLYVYTPVRNIPEFQFESMNEQSQNQTTPNTSSPRRLYRSVVDRKLAGVCGGVAEYFGIDTGLVRVLWIISCFFGLSGALAYIVVWAIVPDNPLGMSAPVRPPSNTGRYIWGTLLIILGLVWLADRHDMYFMVPWRWHYFWPDWLGAGVIFSVFLIGVGLFLVFRGSGDNRLGPASTFTATSGFVPREGDTMNAKRLTRSKSDRMIGGVCGGMGEYFNIDPSLVRVGWVLLTFFSGFFLGIIAYIVLMVVVPESVPEHKNSTSMAQ